MRHASPEDIKKIESVIIQLRGMRELRERSIGHFYYKGINVIHFHVDGESLYADIGNLRLKVDTSPVSSENHRIVEEIREYMNQISMMKK